MEAPLACVLLFGSLTDLGDTVPMEVVDVCNVAQGSVSLSASIEVTTRRACEVLGSWSTISGYLAPEVTVGPFNNWSVRWNFPTSHILGYSAIYNVLTAVAHGIVGGVDVNAFSHMEAGSQPAMLCEVLAHLAIGFLILGRMSMGKASDFQAALLYLDVSPNVAEELLLNRNSRVGGLVQTLLITPGLANMSAVVSFLGLLQWLHALLSDVRQVHRQTLSSFPGSQMTVSPCPMLPPSLLASL